MYINFWYPVARSEDVTNKEPCRVQLLGLRFVAFRTSDGSAHVMSDVCIHRGGSLGKGWVRDDSVVCPYHGWRFGADGRCTHIPTLPDESPPARSKIDSYPVQEKYGIVFAFLGDLPECERPPLHEIEEFEQTGWRANKLTVFEVPAFYERCIENGLDPSHNEFVHPAQGSPNINANLRKKPLDVEEVPWGSRFLVRFENKPTEMGTKALADERTLVDEVTAVAERQRARNRHLRRDGCGISRRDGPVVRSRDEHQRNRQASNPAPQPFQVPVRHHAQRSGDMAWFPEQALIEFCATSVYGGPRPLEKPARRVMAERAPGKYLRRQRVEEEQFGHRRKQRRPANRQQRAVYGNDDLRADHSR